MFEMRGFLVGGKKQGIEEHWKWGMRTIREAKYLVVTAVTLP